MESRFPIHFKLAARLIEADMIALCVRDQAGMTLLHTYGAPPRTQTWPDFSVWNARQRTVRLNGSEILEETGFGAIMAVALHDIWQGGELALLAARKQDHPFNDRDRHGLRLVRDAVEDELKAPGAPDPATMELMYSTYYDGFAALPNESLFKGILQNTLHQAGKRGEPVVVAVIGIDPPQNVTLTLGEPGTARLLEKVIRRLAAWVGTAHVLGSLGSGCFALILRDTAEENLRERLDAPLAKVLGEPFNIGGTGEAAENVVIGYRTGVAVYPEHADDPGALVACARVAMDCVRSSNEESMVFSPAMRERPDHFLKARALVTRALTENRVTAFFQPQFSVAHGGLTGFEALARITDGDGGLVMPGEFLPWIEETGLIEPMTQSVFTTIHDAIRAWGAGDRPPFRVALNLSGRQLRENSRIIGDIDAALDSAPKLAQHLEIEVTESSLMEDADTALALLNRLKQRGVSCSIDDFGTGYSSLAYLKRLPIDKIKIDISFIRNITTEAGDQTIVRAIIEMGHAMGLTIVAEGVETQDQLSLLRELECDVVQGFLLGRPESAETAGRFLSAAPPAGSSATLPSGPAVPAAG